MGVIPCLANLLAFNRSRISSLLCSWTILPNIVHLQGLESRKKRCYEAYQEQLDLPQETRKAPRWSSLALLCAHGVPSCPPVSCALEVHGASSRTCAMRTQQQRRVSTCSHDGWPQRPEQGNASSGGRSVGAHYRPCQPRLGGGGGASAHSRMSQ